MESSGGRRNQAFRVYAGVIKLLRCGCVQTTANGRTWPFLPVNEGLNGAESDFRFVLESSRLECMWWGRVERLLMAESRRRLTVKGKIVEL